MNTRLELTSAVYSSIETGFYLNFFSKEQEVGLACVSFREKHFYISCIWSSLKGGGKTMIQKIVEENFARGFQGEIRLNAAWNSHGFHWKMGFRVEPSKNHCLKKCAAPGKMMTCEDTFYRVSDVIKKRLMKAREKNERPKTEDLKMVAMYLPPASIKLWKKMIVRPEKEQSYFNKLLLVEQPSPEAD